MQVYFDLAENISRKLDQFRGVNKTIVQATLAGLGAFLGSVGGLSIVSLFVAGDAAFLRVGIWDAILGLGIGTAIATVHSWHLGRLEIAGRDLLQAAVLSSVGGFLAGICLVFVKGGTGFFFQFFWRSSIPHVLGWTAEGLVIGLFISRAVPNLNWRAGGAAGAAAGILGGIITNWGVWIAVGDTLKGIFLGTAIALAERLARKAWITVDRTITRTKSRSLVLLDRPPSLLLGEQPILIGNARSCQVYVDAEGAAEHPSVLASIELRDGRILWEDRRNGERCEVRDGDRLDLDDVRIQVHAEHA